MPTSAEGVRISVEFSWSIRIQVVSGIQVITGIGVIPMILTQIHYKKKMLFLQ